ncbi:MAG: MotA/TolQ/ExbB proton channel family protein [Alphaproteobacteria bacterium]|nr:MotA/TolQ/ExbB proton channel family protein [Alphaproteobacteria bacterium]
MSYPTRYIIRMIVFLMVIATIVGLLYSPLSWAFFGNPVINGIILMALIIGIGFIFRQTIRLLPEYRWMRIMRSGNIGSGMRVKPSLLATVAVMFSDENRLTNNMSAQSMRSVLDGVAVRLDESREISRYLIGLLVFLGLLGTFWGLLETIQAVGFVVSGIDTQTADFGKLMQEFKSGLDAPLSGMATAFSSSLFGLAGSLILGFLDLQLGQASSRFYSDLEDWLSTMARFGDGGGDGLDPAISMGLSEEAADRMLELTRHIGKSEQERGQMLHTLQEVNKTLLALRQHQDQNQMVAEGLDALQQSLSVLAHNMANDRKDVIDAMTTELRALSRAVAAISRKAN